MISDKLVNELDLLLRNCQEYIYGDQCAEFAGKVIEYHTGRPVMSIHHLSFDQWRQMYRDLTIFMHGECNTPHAQPGDKPPLAIGMFKARNFATVHHKMEVYEKALAKVLQWAQPCGIDNHVTETRANAKAVIYAIVAPILQNATPPVPMDFTYSVEHCEGPASEGPKATTGSVTTP